MSLQKDIYHTFKDAIIYGEMSPGEKLSEIELEEIQFKVASTL